MSGLTPVSPERAATLMRDGAMLVDIRERDEFARERIDGARHHAVSMLDRGHPARPGDKALVFLCKSGNRTTQHARRLANGMPPGAQGYMLEGGIDAWRKAGLPVTIDRKAPIPLMRQVQIGAGGLVVLGAVLGATVSPSFHLLSAFVGTGLVFAGLTGFCGMARILAIMPWNRDAVA